MTDLDAIAREVRDALTNARQIAPFSARGQSLSLAEAYAVTARVRALRRLHPVGRKIGFTNRNIWPQYNADRPIWGYVSETSLVEAPDIREIPLAPYCEPRIEPEIVLGLSDAPAPDMDTEALMRCIGWVAPGFEVVQSIYPGWRFETGDSIAAGGLHGCLAVGARHPSDPDLLGGLPALRVSLRRDRQEVGTGIGANALDGPVHALGHLCRVLADDPGNPPLAAGEIITTGTLTDALPVHAGESWEAVFDGAARMSVRVRFA